ncbi:hypothetical protein CLCR_11027 [Cladophialophora carrionii]|uniref:Uncharacterized protein n=1 Tax=Cladophialophora carrionii TaxID=86049 RepID=A0A1C1CX53_9EURO|nr:hypothetical protein CLCR_11027 [Cladophialophora carrionii]
MPDATSSADFEDETDIDVPPELAGNNHEHVCVGPYNKGHSLHISAAQHDSLEGAPSYAIATESTETCGSLGANHDSDIVYQRHWARADSRPDLLELPEALYSNTVDLHARRWLKDFCA